jgi:L-asparaginase
MNELNPIKKIIILTTGGTIEKTYDEEEGMLYNRETVIRNKILQKLRTPYLLIEVKSIMSKDSLDMDDQDRKIIKQAIERFSQSAQGIVVLHGTDTVDQTMRYCHEQLSTINIPVVFTGAMKPLGFDDSDALQNIIESICAVQLLPLGIYLSFHARIFSAPNLRKNRSKRTFEAI